MPIPRWQEIHDSLKARIESGELKPDTVIPSELEVAAEWGVSRLTAHRALYELARGGHVVRRRKAGTVVLPPVVPSVERSTVAALFFEVGDYFQGNYLSAIRRALGDDCNLMYVETARDPLREAQMLKRLQKEAAAIVLFATCSPENDALIGKIARSGPPIVCIDRFPVDTEVDAVATDNYGTTRDAVRQLQAAGHTRIAYFTDNEMGVASVRERCEGYRDAMIDAGVDPNPLIRMFPFLGPNTAEEHEQMLQLITDALVALRHGPHPPTAVLGMRDHYVAALTEACERIGIAVPDEMDLIGFVDRPKWLLRLPEATWTIQQDTAAIAEAVVDRIRRRLAGEKPAPTRCRVAARILPPGVA